MVSIMEWTDAEKHPPKQNGKFTVKLENGETKKAYFYTDSMAWIAYYGGKPTAWWDCKTHQGLYNVTGWQGNDMEEQIEDEYCSECKNEKVACACIEIHESVLLYIRKKMVENGW